MLIWITQTIGCTKLKEINDFLKVKCSGTLFTEHCSEHVLRWEVDVHHSVHVSYRRTTRYATCVEYDSHLVVSEQGAACNQRCLWEVCNRMVSKPIYTAIVSAILTCPTQEAARASWGVSCLPLTTSFPNFAETVIHQ